LIRAWEYRQRNYSKGVWYRLRRALVDAAGVWLIDESDADRLESRGHVPLPVGRELFPPKRLFYIDERDLRDLSGPRQIPVRLSAELLQAPSVVLVRHAKHAPRLALPEQEQSAEGPDTAEGPRLG
jgi:hypothetical protein